MDGFEQFSSQSKHAAFGSVIAGNIIVLAVVYVAAAAAGLPLVVAILIGLLVAAIMALAVTALISRQVLSPFEAVWQTVLHLNPASSILAPDLAQLKAGRELVTNLTGQLFQLADTANKAAAAEHERLTNLSHNFVAQNIPLPLLTLDSSETITFANEAAVQYIGIASADLIGKNVYMVLDMAFPSSDTFDTWLKTVKAGKATASNSWERVRLGVRDNHPVRLFDLAAYYNRDNPQHIETLLVLFDHTKMYSQDEQAVSFIALSVHELRTPLTLLRGYIEVFEEELEGKVDAELNGFMQKMHSQAEQLTAFVNNILNVARIDDDQLELQLQEADWGKTLRDAVEVMALRAKVRGITLKGSIAPGLPSVGVDRLSIREVINNLIDNAIKYSGNSKVIEITTALNKEGMVETTVRDYGLGISASVLPNLFTKFYRDHRNRAQIGGTGLGLYLCKAIVTAHGGTVSVSSHEGQGSAFSFTLVPYAQLADEKKSGDEITRGAHGWIKNHSLYRR